jgi:hypothetical protein
LYFSPNIIRDTNSRRMKGAGCVAHVGKESIGEGLLVVKTEERNHLEDLVIDGRIILKSTLKLSCELGTALDLYVAI